MTTERTIQKEITNRQITRASAEWWAKARLSRLTPHESREFQTWLDSDPRALAAYRKIEQISAALGTMFAATAVGPRNLPPALQIEVLEVDKVTSSKPSARPASPPRQTKRYSEFPQRLSQWLRWQLESLGLGPRRPAISKPDIPANRPNAVSSESPREFQPAGQRPVRRHRAPDMAQRDADLLAAYPPWMNTTPRTPNVFAGGDLSAMLHRMVRLQEELSRTSRELSAQIAELDCSTRSGQRPGAFLGRDPHQSLAAALARARERLATTTHEHPQWEFDHTYPRSNLLADTEETDRVLIRSNAIGCLKLAHRWAILWQPIPTPNDVCADWTHLHQLDWDDIRTDFEHPIQSLRLEVQRVSRLRALLAWCERVIWLGRAQRSAKFRDEACESIPGLSIQHLREWPG